MGCKVRLPPPPPLILFITNNLRKAFSVNLYESFPLNHIKSITWKSDGESVSLDIVGLIARSGIALDTVSQARLSERAEAGNHFGEIAIGGQLQMLPAILTYDSATYEP